MRKFGAPKTGEVSTKRTHYLHTCSQTHVYIPKAEGPAGTWNSRFVTTKNCVTLAEACVTSKISKVEKFLMFSLKCLRMS